VRAFHGLIELPNDRRGASTDLPVVVVEAFKPNDPPTKNAPPKWRGVKLNEEKLRIDLILGDDFSRNRHF